MKKVLLTALIAGSMIAPLSNAADYVIDTKGAHAFINFKIKHLGYSWLTGRFDKFTGGFSYDASNLAASTVNVKVDTSSFNSNHAERDKHIRGKGFLNVGEFSTATFESTSFKDLGNDKIELKGDLTLHGVTKEITIDAEKIGEGKDPWGGYRAGFSGTTKIGLKEFGMQERLGPASTHVELELHIEGIRQ
ncbi:YceI family protein [Marinomonas agarivorans]|nr:YceI family protein [Marinomonas agarivorans]